MLSEWGLRLTSKPSPEQQDEEFGDGRYRCRPETVQGTKAGADRARGDTDERSEHQRQVTHEALPEPCSGSWRAEMSYLKNPGQSRAATHGRGSDWGRNLDAPFMHSEHETPGM